MCKFESALSHNCGANLNDSSKPCSKPRPCW